MWLLQMLKLVLIGGSEVRDHAAVVASNDHTALSSGLDIINTIFGVHAGLLASLLQEVGIFVLTDAANVGYRVIWEDVLTQAALDKDM
jgi:hypothetical protein